MPAGIPTQPNKIKSVPYSDFEAPLKVMDNIHLSRGVPVNYIPSNESSFPNSDKPQNFTGKYQEAEKNNQIC